MAIGIMQNSMRILLSISFLFLLAATAMARPVLQETSPIEPYSLAQKCYHSLKTESASAKEWNKCIQQFDGVAKQSPKNEYGIKALFTVGRLYQEKNESLHDPSDLQQSIAAFNQFLRDHPDHALADDALFRIGVMRLEQYKDPEKAKKAFTALLERYPQGDRVAEAKNYLDKIAGVATPPATAPTVAEPAPTPANDLVSIQHTAGSVSSVTLTLSQPPVFKTMTLPPDPTAGKPERVVIDLENTHLGPGVDSVTFKDPLVPQVRVALQPDQGLRVVLDTQGVNRHEVKQEGNQLIIVLHPPSSSPITTAPQSAQEPMLIHRVVIDPGHGGKDPGAIGPRGTKEKDVSLQIAKKLALTLKKELGLEVFLTRTRDQTLSLEDRTAFAEKQKADLFISIHANAADAKSVGGVQTFYLNNASSKAAERLAARENKVTGKDLGPIQKILTTMLQNATTEESKDLAQAVHHGIVKNLNSKYLDVEDQKVHSALFYVLVGTKIPSVLVETSFITNPKEERRLKDSGYQWDIVKGITSGVQHFEKSQTKMASTL